MNHLKVLFVLHIQEPGTGKGWQGNELRISLEIFLDPFSYDRTSLRMEPTVNADMDGKMAQGVAQCSVVECMLTRPWVQSPVSKKKKVGP
jgi:hypothetical protein